MRRKPLLRIIGLGQYIWLDFLNHGVIHSGDLRHWMQEDGLSGIISDLEILDSGHSEFSPISA